MDLTADLESLKRERKRAIDNCEFPRAKTLDLHIRRITEELAEARTEERLITNRMEYEKVKETVKGEAEQAHSNAVCDIYAIRSRYQQRRTELVGVQTDELAQRAESLAADLELTTIRGVPDYIVMKREAQTLAKCCGAFDQAEELYQMANVAQEITIAARQAGVRGTYERTQEHLLKRHDSDVVLNQEKQEQRVGEVAAKYQKHIEKLQKQLTNAAAKYQVAQDFEEEGAYFVELVLNEEEMDEKSAAMALLSSGSTPPRSGQRSPMRMRSPKTPRTTRSPKTPKSPTVL